MEGTISYRKTVKSEVKAKMRSVEVKGDGSDAGYSLVKLSVAHSSTLP